MEIITDKSFLNGFWPVSALTEAYPTPTHLVGYAAVADSDGSSDPDKTALVVVRAAIDNSERAANDQKFMVAVRFYSFGDMATIDVISLDHEMHREIAYEHAVRSKCVVSEDKDVDTFGITYRVPFVYAGAHLQVNDGNIRTFATSGDFGDALLGTDALAIADYVLSICGLSSPTDTTTGQTFVESLIKFMLEHKRQRDFYEAFVESQIRGGTKFTGQQLGGLMAMKCLDRVLEEGGDIIQIVVQEITGDFKRAVMFAGMAAQMKRQ